uniref:Uncharacterized protein n=1 Tax=Trypanosoma congolense (strain IL3000) TaxID=1068625 RepID=G0UX66_TRYCI|nr:conserved hypothetical protein [Trypanosoma congolense IL3000]
MIPVAGRRRGLAPTSNSAGPVDNGSSSFLGGAIAPSPAPVAAQDALSFLDFDDDVPMQVPSLTGASRKAVVPDAPAQAAPSFLDFDDDDDKPALRSAPTHPAAPAAARDVSASGAPTRLAPSFLDFDDDDNVPVQQPAPSMPFAQVPLQLESTWRELQEELRSVQTNCSLCEESIRRLENGEDELCAELKSLEEQFQLKQEEEAKAISAEEDFQRDLELHRQKLKEKSEETCAHELTESSDLVRARVEGELNSLIAQKEEQKLRLLAVEERHNAMDKSLNSVELHERAVSQLQERLKEVLNDIGTTTCLRIKPVLTNSIRDTLAQFAQERSDMLSNDRNRRREQLLAFRKSIDDEFLNLREERRAKHQGRADAIFGGKVFKTRSELERHVTDSRERFMQTQRAMMEEARKNALVSFNSIACRGAEDTEKLQAKLKEELKSIEMRYAAELAHHARLQAAERDSISKPRGRGVEKTPEISPLSITKVVEKDSRYLRERVEQLRHSVLLDIQDLSATSAQPNCESLALLGKERMLGELEEKTRLLSRQFGMQWQRFKAAVEPLYQCVNRMARELEEARVRAAAQQYDTECIYREWTQDVRRELSRCLITGGVPSNCAELQSGLTCLTRVVEVMLGRAQSLLDTQKQRCGRFKVFEVDMKQQFSSLVQHRATSNGVLRSVFDQYESLFLTAVEVEAKRKTLEVGADDYEKARDLLAQKKAVLDEKVKAAQKLSEKLRRNSQKYERKVKHRLQDGNVETKSTVMNDIMLVNLFLDNMRRTNLVGKQNVCTPSKDKRSAGDALRRSLDGSEGRDENLRTESVLDFVTLLSFDGTSSHSAERTDDCSTDHSQPCRSSRGAASADPSGDGTSGTCYTTPSTFH